MSKLKPDHHIIREKKGINLTEQLKPYKRGWVAIDQQTLKVIAHASTFSKISKIINPKNPYDILLIPAAKKYPKFVL